VRLARHQLAVRVARLSHRGRAARLQQPPLSRGPAQRQAGPARPPTARSPSCPSPPQRWGGCPSGAAGRR
jgi:hypothetical protein